MDVQTLTAILVMLEPSNFRIETAHVSHISQHEPFTDRPTEFGTTSVGVIAHWDLSRHTYLELGEAYCVNGCGSGQRWDTPGPKEMTSIRVGYQWQLK